MVKLYSETYLQENCKGLEFFSIAGRFCLMEVLEVKLKMLLAVNVFS
jgi:hypothetical protein